MNFDFWTPIKYFIFIMLSLFFFSLFIRVIAKNIFEVYFETKYLYFIKMANEGLITFLKKGEIKNGKN